jgi:hypothetical protein
MSISRTVLYLAAAPFSAAFAISPIATILTAIAAALLLAAGHLADTRRRRAMAERDDWVKQLSHVTETRRPAELEPKDAIPAGYPGYPRSIRLIHYGAEDIEGNPS